MLDPACALFHIGNAGTVGRRRPAQAMSRPDNARIDESFIDDLQPQERRYDVTVGDELVVAVLPNGAKTWTWVHTGPGRPRRQTLGVYPEMDLAAAQRAVTAAAQRHRREDQHEASDYVIRDGRIQLASGPAPARWPLIAGALVLLAGGAAAYLLLAGPPAEVAPGAGPAVRAGGVAESMTLDMTLAARPARAAGRGEDVGPTGVAGPQTPPAGSATELVPAAAAATASRLAETAGLAQLANATPDDDPRLDPVTSLGTATAADPQPAGPDAASAPGDAAVQGAGRGAPATSRPATASPANPAAKPAARVAAPSAGTPAERPAAPLASAAEQARSAPSNLPGRDPQTRTDPPETSPTAPRVAGSAPLVNVARTSQPPAATAGRSDPAPSIAGTPVALAADIGLLDDDPRVARAALTSAVVEREPVDALGPLVLGDGGDLQTFYFFTELRQLAGQSVRHRWIAAGRIQAEVPFAVGDAWRWRVYSSKRLLRSQAGDWRVQVVLDDGAVIYSYPFEYRP